MFEARLEGDSIGKSGGQVVEDVGGEGGGVDEIDEGLGTADTDGPGTADGQAEAGIKASAKTLLAMAEGDETE